MLKKTINSFKKEKQKISKTFRNNYLSTKTFWKPKHRWFKSVITEHPKTSHKLSNTIRQAEKVSSNSSFYSHTKKQKNFNEKNVKIIQWKHAFKSFASAYNIEILNSFNHELQLKDTESAIKSKLIEILAQSKGFKFVTTLVLVFKKIVTQTAITCSKLAIETLEQGVKYVQN